MSYSVFESAVLRTVCFHEAWGYAPTLPELILTLDAGEGEHGDMRDVMQALERLEAIGAVRQQAGRIGYADALPELVAHLRERELFQPRKRQRARQVVRWLSRIDGVRFVALANTTALGNARDAGDLDFFVIVRAGTLWTSRLLGGAPFKLMGRLPEGEDARDAVCLSYYVSDHALDLSSHMLRPSDPYFRQWFLALLPLFDDGIGTELWQANTQLRARHPFARLWQIAPDLNVQIPSVRLPMFTPIEHLARAFQMRWFPPSIRTRMNQDTRVLVSDSVLKLHVYDGREMYREKYNELCRKRGVAV